MDPDFTPAAPAPLLSPWLPARFAVRDAPPEDLRSPDFAWRDFAGAAAPELRRPNFPLRAFN
jgi:hypothetical protein